MVTIRCLVYNHAKFLRQCLDGFVMQKTNFPFEAIVHDDASTDGSTEILREYAEKYPDIIKPIYEEENQFSKKNGNIGRIMDANTRGKYVAYCEGDDFWTSPDKLQKQVDFLESHPDFSICYHKVNIVNEDSSLIKGTYPNWLEDKTYTFTLEDFEERNIIQTNSVMYRWRFHTDERQKYFWCGIQPGDWMMHMLHAAVGKVHYMPEIMAAYRHHDNSIWNGEKKKDMNSFWEKQGYAHSLFFKNARANFPQLSFDKPLHNRLKKIFKVSIERSNYELLLKINELFPEELKLISDTFIQRPGQLKQTSILLKTLRHNATEILGDLRAAYRHKQRSILVQNILTLGLRRRKLRAKLRAMKNKIMELENSISST